MKLRDNPELTNCRPEFTKKKTKFNQILNNLGAPHVESFNYMLTEGLNDCVENISPVFVELSNGDKIRLRIEECTIAPPMIPLSAMNVKDRRIYPSECRQRGVSYKGMCSIRIGWDINGLKQPSVDKDLGEIPIMMKSSACHLNGLKPYQLIDRGEHEHEWGGQFLIKGHEKLIRMLLMSRRNYPIAIKRSTWKDRGYRFSDIGVLIRSVKTDQTSTNNVLHFINNGTAKFMFSYNKLLSYLPVVLLLKSLENCTDEYIYKGLSKGFEGDQYYLNCIQNMIREVHDENIHTHEQCKAYLGQVFRSRFYGLPSWYTNANVADFLLDNTILIHLTDNKDKFNLLIYMVQKLFQVAQGKCLVEGADGIMMQELLLAGHLYQKLLKEKLESFLQYLKINILKREDNISNFKQNDFLTAVKYAGSIDKSMENFLATGNISSRSGLGLMQNSGLVIMAENINRMRYMSHFRAVHRGSYFVEMRTTEARQLLPDAWGFICPVHTPDGSPCGLLNHLTVNCKVSGSPDKNQVSGFHKILCDLGMIPLKSQLDCTNEIVNSYTVMLEGRVIGYVNDKDANHIVNELRLLKIQGILIPNTTEIVLVPKKQGGQYPGIFIFVGAARMMRPVKNLKAGQIELIGTFEQVYMDICIKEEEAYEGVTTHAELSDTSFMSNLANLIPMPDCNQSPRNMYQCQMGKQTMGTPLHYWQLQAETKMYRLQTPATPLFRPVHYDNIELDDFAMGTNAIVAVISYTGYDMEDAMIINKSAFERGFAHGQVYHSEFIELKNDSYFARDPHDQSLVECLDTDGFPHAGSLLTFKSPMCCYFDTNEAKYMVHRYKSSESCIIDNIKLCGGLTSGAPKKACITYRVPRNPSVGDKFASRAGQKGICSQKWPAQDLPFTDSGIIPDIIFNPHGFPSRMTIAMMIETMAGKHAAIKGNVYDATPFKFGENNTAVEYFAKQLESCGYNYYGTEQMYSGTDGRELKAEIFVGIVHYQRLRHMVSDKWQVRSTGPIDMLTHQPLKGRKRGGGVRFGEMERDALISHGAAFLLQDRLFHCSDKCSTIICKSCGTILGPIDQIKKRTNKDVLNTIPASCRLCGDGSGIGFIEIPYIFKFLVTQLSSMNINVKLNFEST